ncbi:hypothetical protein GEMRC1_001211 [Eukaryota sp. GEM-RC1]
MKLTTQAIAKEFNAIYAYTQSDEINLLLHKKRETSMFPYENKPQKLISVASSFTSVTFYQEIINEFPELNEYIKQKRPHFDARAFSVPNLEEGVLCFYIREMDLNRNAVSSLARANFSSKQLANKKRKDMMAMMKEIGVIFNDMPSDFRFGTYFRTDKMLDISLVGVENRIDLLNE